MTLVYWALEYSKVHIAYMILMFLWPSLLFKKYLKGKSLTFRFGFCATAGMLIINTFVLILGLVGLLKPWFFRLLFYGSILVSLYFGIPGKRNAMKQAARVLVGTYGFKQLLLTAWTAFVNQIKKAVRTVLRGIEGHVGEYILLAIVLLYGMIYFTYGAFQMYSYGFGDMYPHNAWIYGLTQGQIFSAGVYPEGMHCFIYSMHILFGIRIYSCMLFTAGVHILVFLLSGYCLFKEVFASRYTPILALTLFLTIDVKCIDEIYSMSRLQWTIPQEFGFYTLFLCAAFLARYLKHGRKETALLDRYNHPLIRWMKKWVYNEDLLVFMMALGCSLAIHFYPTIMAFFLCLAFVPMKLHKIVRPKRLFPLMTAAFMGFFIAVVPMGLALASGIPFQGSIGWAVNVINGTDGENQGAIVIDETTGEEITGDLSSLFNKKDKDESTGQNGTDGETGKVGEGGENGAGSSVTESGDGAGTAGSETDGESTGNGSTGGAADPSVQEPVVRKSVPERIKDLGTSLYEKGRNVYWYAYVTLYREERASTIGKMTALALILFLICKILNQLYRVITGKKEVRADIFDGYLALTLGSIFFMMMYAANSIGLPSLIAGSRLCSVSQLLIVGVCLIPADLVLFALGRRSTPQGMAKLSVGLVLVIYIGTILTDNFHGYLYYELTRYNGAVMVTKSITEKVPKNKFTIVSTVDELYQIIQYGYHEEAIQFINDCVDNDYVLPSEYVFIYVEKHPIEYAQSHFASGPGWLAVNKKYPAYYNSFVSEGKRINNGTISPELGEAPFYRYPISSRAYSELATRVVVESRLERWCEEFDRLYPNELHVYYEDEDFKCYYFKQNPACLYQLGIQ